MRNDSLLKNRKHFKNCVLSVYFRNKAQSTTRNGGESLEKKIIEFHTLSPHSKNTTVENELQADDDGFLQCILQFFFAVEFASINRQLISSPSQLSLFLEFKFDCHVKEIIEALVYLPLVQAQARALLASEREQEQESNICTIFPKLTLWKKVMPNPCMIHAMHATFRINFFATGSDFDTFVSDAKALILVAS